jgi:hypothetical protein
MEEGLRPFFEERNLLVLAEVIAQKYGLTPYEVLTCMTIYEFSFNVAVFAVARIEEDKAREKDPNIKVVPLSAFGIEVKKEKAK